MLVLWVIAASVILLTVAVLVYMVPGSALSKITDMKSYTLDTTPQPTLDTTYVDTFMKNEQSTFRIFYYIKGLPRTGVITDDTTNQPNLNPITNNYDICDNTNGDCIHKGFQKLLTFGTSFSVELLQAPDASRPNLPKTQICIQTTKNTSTGNVNYIETFPIPAFPMQKWVMFTVSRQGHRFDIYYNDTLQASIKTTNVPNLTATSATLGETSIRGIAKYPKVMNTYSRPEEVGGDFRSMTNTRGEPYDNILPIQLPSLCPSGDCFSGPKVKPANPLVDWSTQYM